MKLNHADLDMDMDAAQAVRDAFRWPVRIVVCAAVALLIVATLVLQGCATISMTTPDGYTAHYTRMGDQSVQGLRFERDNLGVVRVVLEKQASEAKVLDMIGALIGAAR